MKELEQLRQVFVAEVDDELRIENERQIQEWEAALLNNENLQSWKEHDVTKQIITRARETYIQCAFQILDRRNSLEQRQSLWAQQDAMTWIIRLASDDPKAEIARIQQQIKAALNATN